jgi:hypothetical protein
MPACSSTHHVMTQHICRTHAQYCSACSSTRHVMTQHICSIEVSWQG